MAKKKVVAPKPGLFPDGTAVQVFDARTTDVERREGRVPGPDPVANGIVEGGVVEFTAEPGNYVLVGVVDEVQSVTVKAKKGTFKLTFKEQTTAGIKYNATAKEVAEALEALSTIGEKEVEVTGGPGDEKGTKPYVVKFLGSLSGANIEALTASNAGLEEEPKTVTVATTTQGSKAGSGGVERTCFFTVD